MNPTIPAAYDGGVFRPLVPVQMAEGTRVEVEIPQVASPNVAPIAPQDSWRLFLEQVEALPDETPADGLSNRDHDRILYGA